MARRGGCRRIVAAATGVGVGDLGATLLAGSRFGYAFGATAMSTTALPLRALFGGQLEFWAIGSGVLGFAVALFSVLTVAKLLDF